MPTFLSAASVVFLAALSLAPAGGWANTGKQAGLLPIHPVESSNPFTFQQSLPDVPNGIARKYLAIDTGGSATCAIRRQDRGIDCWGLNELGQASAPPKGKFKALSVGGSVGCALTVGNRLVCWGLAGSRPQPGEANLRYVDVSVGEDHVCAIQAGKHTVACWGDNAHGQLNAPQGPFKAISSRAGKACGLRQNGKLECWGDPAFLAYPRPAGKFKDVSVGTLHGCAVRTNDGSIACWGNGYYGETQPPTGHFKSVTSGTDHTCGVRTDRTAVCWGRNQWSQLDIPHDLEVRTLMAGGAQTCGLDRNNHVFCHGSFAYNGLLFPHPSDAEPSAVEQGVYPQIAVVDDLASGIVTNFVGNLLGSWGDSSDSGFLLFIGGLLGYNSDKETQRKLGDCRTFRW